MNTYIYAHIQFLYFFIRSQANRSHNLNRSSSVTNEPEPPNLTNPKRVKKLTKFFGEDPPLMRLFLKKLGYEVRVSRILGSLLSELMLIVVYIFIRVEICKFI